MVQLEDKKRHRGNRVDATQLVEKRVCLSIYSVSSVEMVYVEHTQFRVGRRRTNLKYRKIASGYFSRYNIFFLLAT